MINLTYENIYCLFLYIILIIVVVLLGKLGNDHDLRNNFPDETDDK
jgi:hypothetical protein